MANVCSRCSTDNADGALVCRQCGAALTPQGNWSRSLIPEDDTFDPLSAPTLVMQHTAPASLPDIEETQPMPPPGGTARRVVWGLASFVVLLGAGVWVLRPGTDAPAGTALPGQAPASAVAQAAAASAPEAPLPAMAASAALPPASAPAVTAPAAQPTAPAAVAPAVAGIEAAAPAAPASTVERRKRIPEPVMRRPVPASAPVATPASEPTPSAPVPAPAAPAAEPVRLRTVAELCAGNSLLTRPFCEHRECAKAEQAGDPVCMRLKEAEEARRSRQ